MEGKEKDIIKLKVALIFKRQIDKNKSAAEKLKEDGKSDPNLVTSYRKWETESGVPIASISEIMTGNRNASVTTLATLISSVGMSFEEFGQQYDLLSTLDARQIKKEISKGK